MNADNELLKKRFTELARKSHEGSYYTFSDFLGLSELSCLKEALAKAPYRYELFGGAPGTERVMARFGDKDEIGYEEEYPIVCIKAEPVSMKFADKLSHRDFLGALMNLGIERSTLGDIPIIDNVGYIFAKENVAAYIVESLQRVKRTDLKLSIIEDIPEGELFKTERKRIQLSGERTDALVAKVFNLSREDAGLLFSKGLVYINGRLCESRSKLPRENDVISVRGYGRMIYRGVSNLSKKGKLNAEVDVYV